MFDYLVTIVLESLIRLSINQSIVQNWERQRQYQTWDRRDQNCFRWGHKSEGKRCFRLSELFPGSVSSRSFFACKCFSGSWKRFDLVFTRKVGFQFIFSTWHLSLLMNIYLHFLMICMICIQFHLEGSMNVPSCASRPRMSHRLLISCLMKRWVADLIFFFFRVQSQCQTLKKKDPPLRLLFLDEQYLI